MLLLTGAVSACRRPIVMGSGSGPSGLTADLGVTAINGTKGRRLFRPWSLHEPPNQKSTLAMAVLEGWRHDRYPKKYFPAAGLV